MRHKCLGAFLVFLLFFDIIFFLAFIQIKMLMNAKLLLQVLDQAKIYDSLSKLGQQITDSTDVDKNVLDRITFNAYSKSLDPVWTKSLLEKNLPMIFDYASGKTKTLDISIDLRQIKSKLPMNLVEETKNAIPSMPECKANEIPKEGSVPDCIPQGTDPQLASSMVGPTDFIEMLESIPDIYTLNDKSPGIAQLKKSFHRLDLGIWITGGTTALFMIFLILLGLSYPISIPRWIGLSLVLPASLIFLVDLFSTLSRSLIIRQVETSLNSTAAKIINPIILAINQNLTRPGLIVSGIILGIGWLLIILSYVIPHGPEPGKQAKPPAPNVLPQATK